LPIAAIFDIDGTLVTFEFDAKAARSAILAELAAHGIDTRGLDLAAPTQTMLDAARTQVERGEVGIGYQELRSKAYAILDAFEERSAALAQPFPGAREILDGLRAGGVRLAVLTNSGRKAADLMLRRTGLEPCFELVITRDETEWMKPRPEGISKAVAILGVQPTSAFYIGDSPYDVLASRRAGVKMVAVSTGGYSEERLREEGADFVIPSLAGLPLVLGAQA
jgi:HAD superfamily hydrolase (TIGR01509 family)